MRMLAANLSFARAQERFLEQRCIRPSEFAAAGQLRAFSSQQYLLRGGPKGTWEALFRGSPIIDPAPAEGEDPAAELADGIGRWMTANMAVDGALPYKYWPSRGRESPADNAIRRFLATLALARLASLRGSAELREAARRNLRFNLNRYFRNLGDGRGVIVERTGAKLGAAAVAGLAIMETDSGEEFSDALAMLGAGVASLADGAKGFRTFFFPAERDGENWNFYSGEALLFQAEAVRRGLRGAPTLEQCAGAFALCRKQHYRKRNPAFVPWHTQACASLYAQTGRSEYVEFALEMADWLLPMQQWDDVEPDLRGRFYNPRRPEFGPPHAASTGAYLEGMADAVSLARKVGDERRASVYDRSIRRGLRALRQVQFRDSRDAFYISKKQRVLGALRTEVYDNAVRVDSAAHALLASIKVLRPLEFDVR